jgi:CRISPR/Cas system-associated exonuclease Cas4 (RecB family)
VESGRLYYCTAAGGYEERVVAIDAAARDSAASFVRTLGNALSAGFMPAAPGDRECEYCDYRRVCGPYEEIRLRHKIGASGTKTRLSELTKLREMR